MHMRVLMLRNCVRYRLENGCVSEHINAKVISKADDCDAYFSHTDEPKADEHANA
jgi:hypothetical protein